MRKLGLEPTGGNHRLISARIREARLDITHFKGSRGRYEQFDRDTLEPLVRSSTSVAQVLIKLGLPDKGRPHYDLTRRLQALDFDTSHFKGRGWSRGESAATHPSVASASRKQRVPDEELFSQFSKVVKGQTLVRRLVELGTPYVCAWCGIAEWRGQPLVLHLDHENGINNDNRRPNLRLLCPNCHSQTPTYCGRNR
jgi:hypothetical protein